MACSGNSKSTTEQNFDFAAQQLTYSLNVIDSVNQKLTNRDSIIGGWEARPVSPRSISSSGTLIMVPSSDWCSGFFPGELWYMYEYTKDPKWKKAAQKQTVLLDREKLNARTHDMGFKMFCSYGNGWRLTKNPEYRNVLIQAAKTLCTRYNPVVGCIRSWDFAKEKWAFPVIIDNMLNLELLFWATKETGDSTFYKIAVNHAETTLKNHFRPDNSSYHVVDYDTITGNVRGKYTHQGYSDSSAWARGQAWALYGYTMCYRETKKSEFLVQAEKVAKYIFDNPNMPKDLVPYWDFNAPGIPNEPRDASAATCMASALYELSLYSPKNAGHYKKTADTILESITKDYRSPVGKNYGFLLLHSTGSKPGNMEVDVPLIYADYYFLEALLRKQKLEKNNTL